MDSMLSRALVVTTISVLAVLAGASAHAAPPPVPTAPIPLWPAVAPGDTGDIGEEKDTTKPGQDPAGKYIIRLGSVSKPTIQVFKPPKGKDTGAAVVVCPGGGYYILAMDLEGTEICKW